MESFKYLYFCPAFTGSKVFTQFRVLSPGAVVVEDHRKFEHLHLTLFVAGELGKGCALAELQHPFESTGPGWDFEWWSNLMDDALLHSLQLSSRDQRSQRRGENAA